jgi:large subunit ribosomal protein L14e
MVAIEIGRVCVKAKGRDAGSKAVIIDVKEPPYVIIEGPDSRRRKCNAKHLHFTGEKIEISRNASREEVSKKLVSR